MKKKTVITLLILALIGAGIGFGTSYIKKSRWLNVPLNKEIESVTQQEYYKDEPVNEEIELWHDPEWSPDIPYFGIDGYRKVLRKRRIPEREVSLRYVLTEFDGSETICYEYADKKHTYIEVPDMGVYRSVISNSLDIDSYYDKIYGMQYMDNLESEDFELPKNYSGASKAIWIDTTDDLQWWDRFVPEEYRASGPQDVRYLIICEEESKTYIGYWYDRQTGQRMSDAYDITYSIFAYDLVTGDKTILIESTGDIFDISKDGILEKYFEAHK